MRFIRRGVRIACCRINPVRLRHRAINCRLGASRGADRGARLGRLRVADCPDEPQQAEASVLGRRTVASNSAPDGILASGAELYAQLMRFNVLFSAL